MFVINLMNLNSHNYILFLRNENILKQKLKTLRKSSKKVWKLYGKISRDEIGAMEKIKIFGRIFTPGGVATSFPILRSTFFPNLKKIGQG